MPKVAKSSIIHSFDYDSTLKRLRVRLHSGQTYEYRGVEPHEHEAFATAGSKGSHFNKFIVPKGGIKI